MHMFYLGNGGINFLRNLYNLLDYNVRTPPFPLFRGSGIICDETKFMACMCFYKNYQGNWIFIKFGMSVLIITNSVT
jgi:hypothetical protein